MFLKLALLLGVAACAQAGGLLAPGGLAYGYGGYGSPYGGYGSHYSGYGSPYGAYASPYSAYPAQPALTTQHQNILRSPYNLGQISTFSKTVDTPYSSVSKSDVRVSNPGLAVAAPAYHGYASPYVSHVGVAAPFGAPVAKVATAGGLLGVAYSAAPAVSHMTYSNGLGLAYAW